MQKILYKGKEVKTDNVISHKLDSYDIDTKINFKNDRIKKFLEKILPIIELSNVSLTDKISRIEISMNSVKEIELEIDKLILNQTNSKIIIDKRLLVLENRIALLGDIQAKILLNEKIENYELNTINQKLLDYIDYYYKIFDKYNDDKKNWNKVNISIFDYDFTNSEVMLLKDYDSDTLKKILISFKNLHFILKLALQEKEVTAVIKNQQKLVNDKYKYKYKVSIDVEANNSKNFFGLLTINVIGVKAQLEKILDFGFNLSNTQYEKVGVKSFIFDNVGNWYALATNYKLFFGTQTGNIKELKDLKLSLNLTCMVIDNDNNFYITGRLASDNNWYLFFLKSGQNKFEKLQELKYTPIGIAIDNDNNWTCADEAHLYYGKSGQKGQQYFDVNDYIKNKTFGGISGLNINKDDNKWYIWSGFKAMAGEINKKGQMVSIFSKMEDKNDPAWPIKKIIFNKKGNAWYGISSIGTNMYYGILGKDTSKFVFNEKLKNFTTIDFNFNDKEEWYTLLVANIICYGNKSGVEGFELLELSDDKKWQLLCFDHNNNLYVLSNNAMYAVKDV